MREYALVVVDEAHNYRNPNAATRAAVLRKLLRGQRRNVLLLTATPVNNSLWDLYHLIRFVMRQDAALADQGILSIDERFKTAAREDPAALSPDGLFPIIAVTTVKRTRAFVKIPQRRRRFGRRRACHHRLSRAALSLCGMPCLIRYRLPE